VLLIERENANLLARAVRVEHDEALELGDQRAVVEVGDRRNLAAAVFPHYGAKTKMTEASKVGNMTRTELRSMMQWAVIAGMFGWSVILGAIYTALFLLTH
jgi:hypothetical protein